MLRRQFYSTVVSSELKFLSPYLAEQGLLVNRNRPKYGETQLQKLSIGLGDSVPPGLSVFEDNWSHKVQLEEQLEEGKFLILGDPSPFAPGPLASHVYGYMKDLKWWNEKFGIDRVFVVSTANVYVMNAWKQWLMSSISERLSMQEMQEVEYKEYRQILRGLHRERDKMQQMARSGLISKDKIVPELQLRLRAKDEARGSDLVSEKERFSVRTMKTLEMQSFFRFVSDPQGLTLKKLGLLEKNIQPKFQQGHQAQDQFQPFVSDIGGSPMSEEHSSALLAEKGRIAAMETFYPKPNLQDISADCYQSTGKHALGLQSRRFALFIEDGILRHSEIELEPHHFTWTTSEYLRSKFKNTVLYSDLDVTALKVKEKHRKGLKFRPTSN